MRYQYSSYFCLVNEILEYKNKLSWFFSKAFKRFFRLFDVTDPTKPLILFVVSNRRVWAIRIQFLVNAV